MNATEARCTGCKAWYLRHARARLTLCCACRKERRARRAAKSAAREPLHENAIRSHEQLEAYFSRDDLTCLLCNQSVRGLYKHVERAHGTTAQRYKTIMNIPVTRGLVGAATLAKMRGSADRTQEKMRAGGFANLANARAARASGDHTRVEWPTYMSVEHIAHMVSSPRHPSNLDGSELGVCHVCGATNVPVDSKVALSMQCRLLCESCKSSKSFTNHDQIESYAS